MLHDAPGAVEVGRSVPVALMEDVIIVVVAKEIIGRAYCHIKSKGVHVDEFWIFLEIKGRCWWTMHRMRGNKDRGLGNAKMKVDVNVSGLTRRCA